MNAFGAYFTTPLCKMPSKPRVPRGRPSFRASHVPGSIPTSPTRADPTQCPNVPHPENQSLTEFVEKSGSRQHVSGRSVDDGSFSNHSWNLSSIGTVSLVIHPFRSIGCFKQKNGASQKRPHALSIIMHHHRPQFTREYKLRRRHQAHTIGGKRHHLDAELECIYQFLMRDNLNRGEERRAESASGTSSMPGVDPAPRDSHGGLL